MLSANPHKQPAQASSCAASTPTTMETPTGQQHPAQHPPHLAAELTDMVIDHLWDDKPALLSCARVCRAWLDASQHHLFHSVRLVGVAAPRGVNAFLRFVEADAPRVGRYVRCLDVTGDRWYSPHHHVKAACLGPRHLDAFMAMPFLRRLSLTSVVWDREDGVVAGEEKVRETRTATPLQARARCALDALTLSHFTSFGMGAAALQDVLAVIMPFADIAELHLLRTNVVLDPTPALAEAQADVLTSPLRLSAAVRLQAMSLGPVSRASTLYTALTRLWFCSTIQSLKIQMGDWAQVSDIAMFVRDTAQNLTHLELDVSSCRSIWVDVEPEVLVDGTDWFSDLKLAVDVPVVSFRLCMRSGSPAVFWSMILSAVAAMPSAIRDINIVATDMVPNGFNDLVRLTQWERLADTLRGMKNLASFKLTFAGMDDFRLAPPARAAFADSFNSVLKQRETLFSKSKISVSLSFLSDPELLL